MSGYLSRAEGNSPGAVASIDLLGATVPQLGTDAARPSAATCGGVYWYATDTQILYYSDGNAWQYAISQADGISAPTPSVFPGLTYLLAPGFASSAVTASGGLTISNDTVNYDWGSQSLKCVTDGAGGTDLLTLSLGSPVDLSNSCLVLGFEIDSFTPYSDFQIRLSSDNFGSANYDYCKPAYTGQSQRWVEAGLWELITINRGAAAGNMSSGQWQQNGTGLANYASVNAIRFKFVDNGGSAPMTVRIGFLAYFTRPSQGIVSVTFDDSRLSQFTVAKPVMDQYNIRGTCYNIGYNVQNAGASGLTGYFSDAQLKQLQVDSHWEMGAHAFTDATGVQAHTLGYDSLTSHDGEIDLLQLKTWLRQQQALGIDSFALPHGTWSLNTNGTPGANPDVLSLMAKYFNTCATTLANTAETYPPANRLKLRRYVAQSTDTATSLMAMVNAAVTNKWWLILAFHNLVASPASSTDFSITEFQNFIPQLATAGAAVLPVGEVWRNPPPAAWAAGPGTGLPLNGGTLTGPLAFSGITNPGVEVASLTTTQIQALTPVNGMVVYDSTSGFMLMYVNGAWRRVPGQLGAEFGPADHGLIAWAFDPSVVSTGSGTALATAGTVYTVKLHIPVDTSVTNILVYLKAAGNTLTSGQCFAALWQGSNGALLGVTADQSSAWASGTVVKTMAISGGPVTAAAGDVYAGFWFNGTTGPTFSQGAAIAVINAGLSATVSRYGTANTGVTTTAPGTLGTIAANSLAIWAGLS